MEPWEILQRIEAKGPPAPPQESVAASANARSRAPIYEPTSLENEKDYFVTPKDVSDVGNEEVNEVQPLAQLQPEPQSQSSAALSSTLGQDYTLFRN